MRWQIQCWCRLLSHLRLQCTWIGLKNLLKDSRQQSFSLSNHHHVPSNQSNQPEFTFHGTGLQCRGPRCAVAGHIPAMKGARGSRLAVGGMVFAKLRLKSIEKHQAVIVNAYIKPHDIYIYNCAVVVLRWTLVLKYCRLVTPFTILSCRFLPRRNSKARDSHERVLQLLLQSGRCLRHRQQSLVLAWRVFLMFYEAIPPQVWSEAAQKRAQVKALVESPWLNPAFWNTQLLKTSCVFGGQPACNTLSMYKHKQTNITH